MKRREVLAFGAATAAAAAAPACAFQGLAGGAFDASGSGINVDAFVGELDKKLVAMTNPLGGILSHKSARGNVGLDRDPHARELVKKSLRSLLMVSAFHDLPEETRLHPAVQSRMWNVMPDMDDSVVGFTTMLERMPRDERRAAAKKLKSDPDLPMRIAAAIDAEAEAVGLNAKGRGRLRGLATTLSWRVKNQPASLLFEDCVGCMQRIVAKRGSEAQRERLLAMQVTQAAFWSAAAAQTTPEPDEPGAPREEEPPEPPTRRPPSEEPRSSDDTAPSAPEDDPRSDPNESTNDLLLGAIALGLGLASVGGAYAFFATMWLGILGATIGALLIMLAVVLIIGGIISLAAGGVGKVTEGRGADLPGE